MLAGNCCSIDLLHFTYNNWNIQKKYFFFRTNGRELYQVSLVIVSFCSSKFLK